MSDRIQLGTVTIGRDLPVVVIAEAACEHLGSLEVAMRLADAAKAAGADVVKFQLHLAEEMIPGSIRFWGGSMDDVVARYELGPEGHATLMRYCADIGVQYLCTPFSAAAAEILDRLGVAGFKTGSGELTNIPMQRAIARIGKPVIVSTGMATLEEIDATVACLREEGSSFMLTNCTSAYPPRYDQVNLRVMEVLSRRYGVLVGHSDHTPDGSTAIAAAALGAPVIEKHFTLSRDLRGPDWHVSLEPAELESLVRSIRNVEAALGDEKTVYDEEKVVREWAHHSVVTVRNVPAGSVLTRDTVAVKRPGTGIPAAELETVIGRRTVRDVPADSLLAWEDLQP